MSTNAPGPGWYPDPTNAGAQRWWDGTAWTDQTYPLPQQPAAPAYPPAPTYPAAPGFPAAPAYAGNAYATAPQVTFVEAIRLGFRKYATFEGRATRAEYWWWALFTFLIYIPVYLLMLVALAAATPTSSGSGSTSSSMSGGSAAVVIVLGLVLLVVAIVLLIPTISVAVRRLHDTGRSGWWYWISLVPWVGGLILLVFMVLESNVGPNQFGPPSRGAADL